MARRQHSIPRVSWLLATLGLAIWPGMAGAFSTLDLGYGTPVDGPSARSVAMGSVGTAVLAGSSVIIQNPSLMTTLESNGMAELNFWIGQADEDRFTPLFNSFESFVANTAISLNKNSFAGATGGLMYRLDGEARVSLGLGVFERYDFDYQYNEEIRDPNPFSDPRDRVVQLRDYSVRGRLRSISGSFAVSLIDYLNLGLTLNYYYATLKHQVVNATQPAFQGRYLNSPGDAQFDHEVNGWGWAIGASSRVSKRLSLGATFEGPFSVEGSITRTDTVTQYVPYDDTVAVLPVTGAPVQIKYPGTLRMGFTFYPRNELKTTFSIDAVYRLWKDVESNDVSEDYRVPAFVEARSLRNTWDLRLGLEHVFYNNLPVRAGFRYLQNYADPESNRSIFSAGVGMRAAGWVLDATVQYQTQTSRQQFLIDRTLVLIDDDGVTQTYPEPESLTKVEDSFIALVLAVTRHF